MLSRAVVVTIGMLLAQRTLPRHTDPFTGMAFVLIPPGTFTMGTPLTEPKRDRSVWTDDYSNILGAVWRRLRTGEE